MAAEGSAGSSSAPSSSGPTDGTGKNKCRGCGQSVKDHVGPCGKGKCLVSLLNGLGDLVSELQTRLLKSVQRHRQELQTMRELHEKRVDTLLATVSSLEERLDSCEVDFSTAASRSDGGLVEVSASQQSPECSSLRATVSRLEERLDRYEADLVGVRETQSTPMSSSDGSVETNASRQWYACDQTDSLAASAGDQSTVGPSVSSACSSAATEVADSVAGVKHDGHEESSSRPEPWSRVVRRKSRKAQSHAGTSSSSRHRQVRNDGGVLLALPSSVVPHSMFEASVSSLPRKTSCCTVVQKALLSLVRTCCGPRSGELSLQSCLLLLQTGKRCWLSISGLPM